MSDFKQVTLPELLQFNNGNKVCTATDWQCRRSELRNNIVELEYGGMPPIPESVNVELLHPHFANSLGVRSYHTFRVIIGTERQLTFTMKLLAPEGEGPFPVIIYGDECWEFLTEAVIAETMRRQCALVLFNRVEIASDIYQPALNSGIYNLYPKGKFGTIAAWAWGFHRCVDALLQLDQVDDPYKAKHLAPIDAGKIAIIGHSRGGKAALLAGATDERIALTCANNSGAGGAGSYMFQEAGSETLKYSLSTVPYWYNSDFLSKYSGCQAELPFDQHFLKALVAPRALLTTEALGDHHANPAGTWLTHQAAREAYRLLGQEERLGIYYRAGGHEHNLADWQVFLDFLDMQFRGIKPDKQFNINPF
jgi:hypothetical protein